MVEFVDSSLVYDENSVQQSFVRYYVDDKLI